MTFRQHVANTSWLEDRNATRRAAGLAMSSVDVFRSTDESVEEKKVVACSTRRIVAGVAKNCAVRIRWPSGLGLLWLGFGSGCRACHVFIPLPLPLRQPDD